MKKFKTRSAVDRTQKFLDHVARAAWEPYHKTDKIEPDYPHDTPTHTTIFDLQNKPVNPLWRAFDFSMGIFRSLLIRAGGNLPDSAGSQPPHGTDIAAPDSNWSMFERELTLDIVASDSVSSLADAVVKASAHLDIMVKASSHGNDRYFFRGQSNIEYDLLPRLGRLVRDDIKSGGTPPSTTANATQLELEALESFQRQWPFDDVDEIDKSTVLNADDPAWWVLMQHYAAGHCDGTRMLDVTSSLLFGLLFACVNWETGLTTDSQGNETDGVLYLFHESGNHVVDDFLVKPAPDAGSFFQNTHGSQLDHLLRMVFNPPHNERSKAQSGGFIWWPKFWEPHCDNALPFLRIPKENKASIAAELLSFGVGPKEAVRGDRGLRNEKNLREQLGQSWNPLGLA